MPLGYAPSVGDVLGYYAADGPFGKVLARWGAGKTVRITDWPETVDGLPEDVTDLSPAGVERRVRALLEDRMPGALPEDVPDRYPGFHATVGKDIVLEIDAKQSQAQAFGDGRHIRDLLEGYGAPYRVKFSGNSSPHFILREAAYAPLLPEGERETGRGKLFSWFMRRLEGKASGWLDSSFNSERHFLRLPYSLNERTGLVSLPIRPEAYDDFEVASAELGRAAVEEAWFDTADFERRRDGMARLLEEALNDGTG